MDWLKALIWLIMVTVFLGIIVPVLWNIWGFSPNIIITKTQITQPITVVEKIVERVTFSNLTNCLILQGVNKTYYECPSKIS